MYHVSAQGVDERMINVHYYYYYVWKYREIETEIEACTHHNQFNRDGDAAPLLDTLIDLHLDDVEDDDADQRDHHLRNVRLRDVGRDGAIRLEKWEDVAILSWYKS